MTGRWLVEHRRGDPTGLHALGPPEPARRLVRVCEATSSAVVIGSAQPDHHVDRARAAAAGLAVTRRRSGGGAVLVEPGRVLWVDVAVPRGDPLWDDDVGRAFWWLGSVWIDVLAAVGIGGAVCHRGGLVRTEWSDRVCFAGTGPGEVLVGGRKAVGMSQRRTRAGALFQCAVPLAWDPDRLVDVLALGDDDRERARHALGPAGFAVPAEAGDLVTALVDRLP